MSVRRRDHHRGTLGALVIRVSLEALADPGPQILAKVAVAHIARRDRVAGVRGIALKHSVPVGEEKEFVPLNGSSQIAADVIEDFLGLAPGVGGIEHFPLAVLIKRVARGEVLVVVIPESSPVQVVRARFGDDVDRCGTRHPLLRIVAVSGDFDFLNTLDRRDIKGGASRFPEEDALGAVNASGIGSGTEAESIQEVKITTNSYDPE